MISANSCNIVRVICEIPLYFYAYFRSQHFPAPLGFSIPISNMKSTYTLCLCEQMRLPISRILLTCRPDSAGEQLFRFGRYRVHDSDKYYQPLFIHSTLERFRFRAFLT